MKRILEKMMSDPGFTMIMALIVVGFFVIMIVTFVLDDEDVPRLIPLPDTKVECTLTVEGGATSVTVKEADGERIVEAVTGFNDNGVELEFEGGEPTIYWAQVLDRAVKTRLYAVLVTQGGCQAMAVPAGW